MPELEMDAGGARGEEAVAINLQEDAGVRGSDATALAEPAEAGHGAEELVQDSNDANQVPTEISLDQRLAKMSRRVKLIQTRVAKAVADIALEVSAVRGRLSDTRLRRFLTAECGVDASELRMYLELDTQFGDDQVHKLVDGRTSFSAMKALAASSDEVRSEALSAIAGGHNVAARDVAAIKRRIAQRDVDPQASFQRSRAKALKKASGRLADAKLSGFGKKAEAFAVDLVEFYNSGYDETPVWNEALQTTKNRLQSAAAVLLRQFRETFDVASLPEPWLYDYHGTPAEEVRLARAHDALRDLAAGVFQAWDSRYHVPFDTDHDFLDRSLVESVIWLCEGEEVPARKVQAQLSAGVVFSEPPQRLSSLEICAGAGGQAIGLHAAGFDALGIYEIKADAVETLRHNHPLGPTHQANVREVDFREYAGRLDLVAGGVPCQSHSSLGLRKGRDDKRDLFLEAVRLVEETRPRAFFFENVQGFAMANNSSYRAELHDSFKALGYDSKVFSFRGDDYGLPQGRPRVAFIGFRDGQLERFRMPPVLTPEPVNLGEALYDLVAKNGWEGARAWADHANVVGPTIVGASDASGRLGFASNFQAEEWIRLRVDPVGIAEDSPMPGHVGPFKLSLAMGARIQGFPDDWEFRGSTTSRKRQIANALPPIMSRAIGLAIYSALTGTRFNYQEALRRPLLGPAPSWLGRLNIARRHVEYEDA